MKKFSSKLKILLIGGLTVATGIGILSSTLAWIAPNRITDISIPSGVVDGYFDKRADGTGTAGSTTNPFVISEPKHLFNLMWLQHSDKDVEDPISHTTVKFKNAKFNFEFGIDNGNGVKQFYAYDDSGVQIKNDNGNPVYSSYLNMRYYSNEKVLIPIGSEADPFNAVISGNNLTVKNMDIYNVYNNVGQMDVGIFGYVESNARISNLYFDNVKINVGNPSYTPVSHGNPTLATHNHINVGYLAGHVVNADDSFEDVYINNVTFENTDKIDKLTKNHFGYFGFVDANDVEQAGTSRSVQLTPESAHSMFSSKYNSISGQGFAVRNSHVPASGNFNNHYSESDGSYSGSDTTSLATSGYQSTTEMVKYASYGSSISGTQTDLNVATQIINESEIEDDAHESLPDGYYAYWDSTTSSWQYDRVISGEGVVTEINFNCFMLSFTENGNKYYLKNNNGSLEVTSTVPNASDQDTYADYYFAFKDVSTSKGVTALSSMNSSTSYKLFSPKYDSYITAPLSGTASTFSFTSSFNSALSIRISGNVTQLIAADSPQNTSYQFLATSSGCYLKNATAGLQGNNFTIEGSDTTHQTNYSKSYTQITDVSELNAVDGVYPIVAFFYEYNDTNKYDGTDASGYYAMSTQAKNNRQIQKVTVTTSNNHNVVTAENALNAPSIANFQVGQTTVSGTTCYTFQDIDSEQYIYAAGTKTSGANYLRSQDSVTSNHYAEWTITQGTSGGDEDGDFLIKSKGNDKVPNITFLDGMTNTGRYQIFRCSNSASNSGGKKLNIYKMLKTNTATIDIENSFVYTARSVSEGTKQHTGPFNIYYADDNTNRANIHLLDIEQVTFNFVGSQVSFNLHSGQFVLVDDIDDLSIGDEIVFVSSGYNAIAQYLTTSHYFAKETVTFKDSNKDIIETLPVTDPDDEAITTDIFTVVEGNTDDSYGFYIDSYADGEYLKYGGDKKVDLESTITNASSWTITIDSNADATITNVSATTYKFQYNASSPRFTVYSSNQSKVQIFKYVSTSIDAQTTYIGDIVGNTYDPNVIDVTGAVTYSSSAITMPGTNNASIPASSTLSSSGSVFYATRMKESVVIYVENTNSRDLGTLTFEFNSTAETSPVYFSRGGGSSNGNTFESIGVSNISETSNSYSYSIPITSNNINEMAYCALDSMENNSRTVYGYYDTSDELNLTGHGSSIVAYVIVIACTSSIDITNIKYEFNSLPGNTGNFGKVGYRSASYITSGNNIGAFDTNASDTTTSGTILNFYIDIPSETLSTVSVSYSGGTYQITIYLSTATNMYVFNYDSVNYVVRVNEAILTGTASHYMVPQSTYDAQTGWSTT